MIIIYIVIAQFVIVFLFLHIYIGARIEMKINLVASFHKPGDLVTIDDGSQYMIVEGPKFQSHSYEYTVTPAKLADRYSSRDRWAMILIPVLQFWLLTLLF